MPEVKSLTVITLIGLMIFVLTGVASAQAGYTGFCNGEKLLFSQLPDTNPCGEGVFKAVELWSDTLNGKDYGDNGVKTFTSYDLLLQERSLYQDGSVYFEQGETVAVEPTATEVTTRTKTLKGAKISKMAIVSEQTSPNAWTAAVCRGAAAIVYQAPSEEEGDGVTVSVFDPVGCEVDGPWFVVEPWGVSGMNADAGCIAQKWNSEDVKDLSTVESLATRNNLLNGSAWLVDEDYATNPLVVDCADVNNGAQLGLNRYENQISIPRMSWVKFRAAQLLEEAGMNLEQYCTTYGEEPLGLLLCQIVK